MPSPEVQTRTKGTRRVSKLTDRFDALGRATSVPIGFATRPRAATAATMLLLGSAPAKDAGKYADAEGVDAIILTGADALAGYAAWDEN